MTKISKLSSQTDWSCRKLIVILKKALFSTFEYPCPSVNVS